MNTRFIPSRSRPRLAFLFLGCFVTNKVLPYSLLLSDNLSRANFPRLLTRTNALELKHEEYSTGYDAKVGEMAPLHERHIVRRKDEREAIFFVPTTEEIVKMGFEDAIPRFAFTIAIAKTETHAPFGMVALTPIAEFGGSSLATSTYGIHIKYHYSSDDLDMKSLLFEVLAQFLNAGGRTHQLRGNSANINVLSPLAFKADKSLPLRWQIRADCTSMLAAVDELLVSASMDTSTLFNIKGRLLHDCGNVEGAIESYLNAVSRDSSRGEVFRSMGGAYLSLGQHQMAFASLQQAISLDHNDFYAYLKLGMLYEQLALSAGKYEGALGHAVLCYKFYLENCGMDDTDVLIRLANVQLRQLETEQAILTYKKALDVDSTLVAGWQNLASAYLSQQDPYSASEALKKAIELDPDLPSAKHLLASLGVTEEVDDVDTRRLHFRNLFDFYSTNYDDHLRKKLLYTGPRLIRSAIREAANETFSSLSQQDRQVHNNDVLQFLNGSLSILDLGCGTGLCGSWLKDYAAESIGVDISQRMIDMATKKGCYSRLIKADMEDFLVKTPLKHHDLIVAGDSLQYVGYLETIVKEAYRVLRPGGWFAFTVPRNTEISNDQNLMKGRKGCKLEQEGTYSYNDEYIEELANSVGFEIQKFSLLSTRLERGVPLPGILGVFKRPDETS